ncbi:MAG: lipopolysaccharide kinase InaA family protein [Desulfuromonadaceae bacterium]
MIEFIMLIKLQRKRDFWHFGGEENERNLFAQPRICIDLEGDEVSADTMSRVIRVRTDTGVYYVKYYWGGGKRLRRFIGRSRAQGEWENLEYFSALGIPTPRLVAYGRHTCAGEQREVLVTAEVENARDLATLARGKPEYFVQRDWILEVMHQVADYARRLHRDGFVHWDMKWRNILVQGKAEPRVFFFDCPLGRHWHGGLQRRGAIKDLGNLELGAREVMTRAQRLRFLLLYRQEERLTPAAKRQIRRIYVFLDSKARRRAKRRKYADQA